MITGLFILTAVTAVILVLNWSAKNDSASSDGKTTGLFAMKDLTSTPTNEEATDKVKKGVRPNRPA